MTMQSKYIWMNGALVEFEKATIHFLTPVAHYGLVCSRASVATPPIAVQLCFG